MDSRKPSDHERPRGAHPRGLPKPEFSFIETAGDLAAFCRSLAADRPVALDTEFVGENTYIPVLEIIQVSDGAGRIGIVDVRAVRDLGPLARVVGDPEREKIFHSAKQDVALLYRHLGVAPAPAFDTQVAAAMVGLGAQVSYVNLVRDVLRVHLPGEQTTSDWSMRPLTEAQLVYAAQDVEFLHPLHSALVERVSALGRTEWLREELDHRVQSYIENDPTPDDERYRGVRDWMKLDGLALAILRELAAWREEEARKRNLSRRLVLSDEALIALSRLAPESRDDVRDLRRVPQGQLQRYLDEILEVVARARRIPKDKWPMKRAPTRPDIPEGLVELFQAIVRATADQESIAANLLSTREELQTLAIRRREIETLDLPVLTGWRRQIIGEKLLALLEGRMHLRIDAGHRVVIDEH